jgi:hypothetical protein
MLDQYKGMLPSMAVADLLVLFNGFLVLSALEEGISFRLDGFCFCA